MKENKMKQSIGHYNILRIEDMRIELQKEK